MYLWKCWRDTRARFLMFLVLWVGLVMAIALGFMLQPTERGSWQWLPPTRAAEISRVWVKTTYLCAVLGGLIAGLAGLVLGGFGVGEEFESGTLPFLATRPRRRRYFVWTSWGVGAIELLVIFSLGIAAGVAVLLRLTGSVGDWRLLALLPGICTIALVTFGFAFLLTLLVRSGRDGVNYALLLALGYHLGVVIPVQIYLQMKLPSLGRLVVFGWPPYTPFPTVSTLGWLLLALAFPVACQLLFERAEL